MDYDIIATLGPGSDTEIAWQAMLAAGVTSFRLNTSHLSLPQLNHWLDRLTPFLSARVPRPFLVLDLQGSKWRLGNFPAFQLTAGQRVELVQATSTDRPGILPVPHPDFFQAAPLSSGEIVLSDAKIRLRLEGVEAEAMRARVLQGGEIAPRKGITYTASEYRQEALNEQDQAILEQTHSLDFIRYALSYVKDAGEMARYRQQLGRSVYLIAKLERPLAVEQALLMVEAADELWLCRGDLGAEMGLPAMAETVYHFSGRLATFSLPVLLAGQVLEHMTTHPTPTRSEVCHLYDALCQGYQGVVLSDETAVGRYPVESCQIAALFKAAPPQTGG